MLKLFTEQILSTSLRKLFELEFTSLDIGKNTVLLWMVIFALKIITNWNLFFLNYIIYVAELLVDRASELRYIGGVFGGNIKPTPFLCLILKMLQIQPDKEIIIELIKQDDFK